MAKYKVIFDDSQTAVLGGLVKDIGSYESRLKSIANAMDSRDKSMATLQSQMKSSATALPAIATRIRRESEVWKQSVGIYKKAERDLMISLQSCAAPSSANNASSSESSRPYTIVITTVGNVTVYERVYPDGYRERISEQGYRVEMARGYIDYSTWGKEPGSISPLDYAIIASIPNMSHKDALQYIIDNFPDDHPFRQGGFIQKNEGGLDYCIFKIDDDHVIVAFGGTNPGEMADIYADFQIGLGVKPDQAKTANEIISKLQCDNIIVTGHSLGGYIASDVAINNNNVTECVVFDAPGRGGIGISFAPENWNPKITNYYEQGDNVHMVGKQPGAAIRVDVGSNPKNYFGVGNHDLANFINVWTTNSGSSSGGGRG